MSNPPHDIADPGLAATGLSRIEWAFAEMPVLRALRDRFAAERPLDGLRVSGCLHITTETANLARVLTAGGARVVLCASNPLSTQDDVAAALVDHFDIQVFACRGEDRDRYYAHIESALAHRPHITLDDGADLVSRLHEAHPERTSELLGGTEETTTGVVRLRAMAHDGALRYPIVAVNEANTKHLFDNRYGTGQSTLDGVLRATNFLIAGRVFTVAGYGWCGRGIAMRARGLGAEVIVTEVDPLRALEATMDGYRVMPMIEAARQSDFIVTATGMTDVVGEATFPLIKDGCVLANSGHFDVEIDVAGLRRLAVERRHPRRDVEELRLPDGRSVRLLAEGRLVNLAAAEGHPAAVMDMSFANQALVVAYLSEHGRELPPAVHGVPADIDTAVARLKLATMERRIDTLSPRQLAYRTSWREGT